MTAKITQIYNAPAINREAPDLVNALDYAIADACNKAAEAGDRLCIACADASEYYLYDRGRTR